MLFRPRTRRIAPVGWIEPCQPSPAQKPPAGANWIHEIKHDGYRMMTRRDGAGIRLLTRNGSDWSERFPSIVKAVGKLRCTSCLIDGEAVVCNADGVAEFNLLRRGEQKKPQAHLFAFDLLELDGEDLRREPIDARKAALAKLLRKCAPGLQLVEHIEGDGETIYAHACKLGLEGIVSKRMGSKYRSGKSSDWIKSKNPGNPAVIREATEDWSR